MRLGEVAHVRSGDKGDVLNMSMTPLDPADWEWLRDTVTVERVRELYAPVVAGDVKRFELPGVPAFNFVLTGTLEGGVSSSMGIDPHGKAWGALLLDLDVGERPAAE